VEATEPSLVPSLSLTFDGTENSFIVEDWSECNTKQYDNYADLITFTRASTGTALRHVGYGSELVTNGTFDTDISGWTDNSSAGGSIAWNAAGYLDLDADAATSRASQDIAVTAGSVYAVSITVVNLGGSSASGLYLDGAASSSINFVVAGVGTHTIYYVAPDSLLNISIRNFTTGTTVSIDNVSVKEVIFDRATDPLVLFNHPTNVPRIEYDADGNRKGLLIEEARTNFVPFSETFSASAGNTLIPNDRIAPDGNLTATNVTANNSANIGVTTFATTGAIASNTYTISLWVYAETTFNFTIRSRGNGTVTEAQNTSVSTVAGQWVRVSHMVVGVSTRSRLLPHLLHQHGWCGCEPIRRCGVHTDQCFRV
jgi:hypothetical protein